MPESPVSVEMMADDAAAVLSALDYPPPTRRASPGEASSASLALSHAELSTPKNASSLAP